MQRLPVDSSDLVAIGYDPKTRLLEIEFKEDRIYQYSDVPPDVYQRFMRADSYGEFFFAHITKHYRYKRVGSKAEPAASSKLRTVAFVTGNARKVESLVRACEPFGIVVEQLDLPVDEIQSHEPQKIALHKAKQAYKLAGRPVVVQDTFWNFLALRGFPGAYMHDVSLWFKPEDFIALMQSRANRTVVRTHTLVYYDGKHSKVFAKDIMGVMADKPAGTAGANIDQVVITAGQTRTNSEIIEQDGGFDVAGPDSAWQQFAKWYHLQQRLGKA